MKHEKRKNKWFMETIEWWFNEFRTQTAYMTCFLCIVLRLFKDNTKYGIIWLIICLANYIILFDLGKKILETLDIPDLQEAYLKRRKFKHIYISLFSGLLLFAALTTDVIRTIGIVAILLIVTIIYYLYDSDGCFAILNEIYYEDKTYDENDMFFSHIHSFYEYVNDHPMIYNITYYSSLLALVIISTIFIPYALWVKAIIILLYIASIPFISWMADKGADITSIFDFGGI